VARLDVAVGNEQFEREVESAVVTGHGFSEGALGEAGFRLDGAVEARVSDLLCKRLG
jgi:hypothetical protein